MGQNDRDQSRKENRKAAAEQKRRRRTNISSSNGAADWEVVDGVLLAKAIACVAAMGGALRLGYTRDGGAYAIGIYGDGDPFTEYVPPDGDIEGHLKGLIEDYGK